ncbi:MAG: hypothetical protein GEU90_14595 [Gemmatimonas sp.]|nr:hypothetical protein [Gemmatimonas sp.]
MARAHSIHPSPPRHRSAPRRSVLNLVTIRLVIVLTFAVAAAGCASAGGAGARPDSSVITEDELNAVFVDNLYQAIERLRPLWLRSTTSRSINLTTEIAVVQNGAYFGPLDTLRSMPASNVTEIRYMSGSEAIARVSGILGGGRHIEAAILVNFGGGS